MPTINEGTTIFGDIRVTKNDPPEFVNRKMAQLLEQVAGKHGFDYINDTASHDGPYIALQACEGTVINSITGEQISESNVTMASTQVILGHITNVELASGSVIAYKAVS